MLRQMITDNQETSLAIFLENATSSIRNAGVRRVQNQIQYQPLSVSCNVLCTLIIQDICNFSWTNESVTVTDCLRTLSDYSGTVPFMIFHGLIFLHSITMDHECFYRIINSLLSFDRPLFSQKKSKDFGEQWHMSKMWR